MGEADGRHMAIVAVETPTERGLSSHVLIREWVWALGWYFITWELKCSKRTVMSKKWGELRF